MKKNSTFLLCLAFSALTFAQTTGKIKLASGQKIVVESTIEMQATLTMGMELTSNSSTINALEVKNSNPKTSTITNTLTKLKMTSNMMGQATNYDSESKTGNDEQVAKIFDDKLNKPVDITVDNATGMAVTEKKKEKKADADAEDANPMADMMKVFLDNGSDDAVVSGAFEMIPKGKSVGDSWSDTATTKDIKTIRTFTLKSVTGSEAIIQSNFLMNAVNKLDFQGMEFVIKTETKTVGEIVTDTVTGLVKKRTTVADITGSIPMMGQDMPISAKATTSSIYK